jgi:hypothetical protein
MRLRDVWAAFERETRCDNPEVLVDPIKPALDANAPLFLSPDMVGLRSLSDATMCEESMNPCEPSEASNPNHDLKPFLRIHRPGVVGADETALNRERAPLLLSTQRHRRIPIDWGAVLDEERGGLPQLDNLRERIEAIWLAEAGVLDNVPEDACIDDQHNRYSKDDFRIVRVDLLNAGLRTEALSDDAIVVADRPLTRGDESGASDQEETNEEGPRRFFSLSIRASTDDPQGIPWSRVTSAVEVFPIQEKKSDGKLEWVPAGWPDLLDRVKLLWSRGPAELTSIFGVSSTVAVNSLRGRMQRYWYKNAVRDALETLLKDVIVIAAPNSEQKVENYWRQDTNKRAAAAAATTEMLVVPILDKSNKWIYPELDSLVPYPDGKPVATPWVLKVGERRYAPIFETEAAQQLGDLTSIEVYEKAWEVMTNLEPLAWNHPGIKEVQFLPFPYVEVVDLTPQLIVEEYARLKSEYDIANATTKLGDNILLELEKKTDAGIEHVRERIGHVRELKGTLFEAERGMRVLADRAKQLGYVLATGLTINGTADNQVQVPTGVSTTQTKTVVVGRLYKFVQKTATFQVRQSQIRKEWGFGLFKPSNLLRGDFFIPSSISLGPLGSFGFGRRRRRRDRLVNVDVRYLDLDEAVINQEPWEQAREKLTGAGFNVVVAELTEAGYCLPGGVPLREVMHRCGLDESFRNRLAVLIPIFQERLTGGLTKVKYLIAIRPEPGDEPRGFPSVYCEETLSYRAEWIGTELGELLNSFSLAPGEERQTSFSRSIERKAEKVDSITSVLDVTQSSKDDLSSSIENTVRNEKTTTDKSNWNANASVNLGYVSGGGGGGGSHEKTVKQFAETIKKQAMTATREMRTNQRQEVKSSTTTTTSVNTSESSQSTIRNINQGSTLNVLFYKLNNIFRAGFFLDDLQLMYQPSVELIAGTNIFDSINYRLQDLPSLVRAACEDPALSTGEVLFDRASLQRRVLQVAMKTLLADYVQKTGADCGGTQESADKKTGNDLLATGVGVLMLDPKIAKALDLMLEMSKTEDNEKARDEDCHRYLQVLANLALTNEPFEPHVLLVPSAAVYADSIVGMLPATERYSERMREVEVRLRSADVSDRLASAALKQSMASGGMITSSRQVSVAVDGNRMTLQAVPPFEAGNWIVLRDDAVMGQRRLTGCSPRMDIDLSEAATGPHKWVLFAPQTREAICLSVSQS